MRTTIRVILPLLCVLATARGGAARCDPSVDPDRTDVANARAAVAAACDCNAAASHREYVRCASEAAETALTNQRCARVVRRCARRSTCGRLGSVTCCRTRSSGRSSCTVKRSAARCAAPRGGTACVGSLPSCCDACPGGTCTETTTTTTTETTTTTSGFPPPCGRDGNGICGGICPSLFDDCVEDAQSGECVCVLGGCRAIGGIGSCGGTCPNGASCTLCAACGGCGCVLPCNGGTAPSCNGTCPAGYACGWDGIDPFCACVPQ